MPAGGTSWSATLEAGVELRETGSSGTDLAEEVVKDAVSEPSESRLRFLLRRGEQAVCDEVGPVSS